MLRGPFKPQKPPPFCCRSQVIDGSDDLKEVFRVFQCEAYNCTVSVISCVQDQEKFYHSFLFKEDPAASEFIWSRLVDDKAGGLTFPLVEQTDEVSREKRTKVVAIRSKGQESGRRQGHSRPHFLGDSSLSQDVVSFDFHESLASLDTSASQVSPAGE